MNKYFSSRSISFVGCFLASLGVGLCFTATSVLQIILYIGIIQGFGIGLTYVQNNAIINQYFIKYRATANGISLSGGTIGSFALSYLVELCLKYYTLQEIFLILSAVILSTLPICVLMKPFQGVSQNILKELNSSRNFSPEVLSVEALEEENGEYSEKIISEYPKKIIEYSEKTIPEYSEKCFEEKSTGISVLPIPEYSNQGFTITECSQRRKLTMSELAEIESVRKVAEYQRRLSQLTPRDRVIVAKDERKRIKENNEQVMKVAPIYLKSYKKFSNGLILTGSNSIMVPVNSNLSNNNGFIRRQSLVSTIQKTVVDITKNFERRVSSGCSHLNQTAKCRNKDKTPNNQANAIKSNCNQVKVPNGKTVPNQEAKVLNQSEAEYHHDRRLSRSYTVNSRTAVLDSSDSESNISSSPMHAQYSYQDSHEEKESVKKLVMNILKNRMFILICLTHMAYFWSSITYTMIIVDFSLDRGIRISHSVHLLNSFAAGDLIGRLASGWFMDNSIFPLQFLALFSTTGIGILLSVTTLANNYYFFLIISAILGLLSGTINILLNVLFCKYVGSDKAALAFGLSAFFCGLCTLGRPLVVGHFRDQIGGSYDGLFITLGIITILIGSLWLFESCIKGRSFDEEEEEPKTVSDEISYVEKV